MKNRLGGLTCLSNPFHRPFCGVNEAEHSGRLDVLQRRKGGEEGET
jgi:hypothetical protein